MIGYDGSRGPYALYRSNTICWCLITVPPVIMSRADASCVSTWRKEYHSGKFAWHTHMRLTMRQITLVRGLGRLIRCTEGTLCRTAGTESGRVRLLSQDGYGSINSAWRRVNHFDLVFLLGRRIPNLIQSYQRLAVQEIIMMTNCSIT